MATSSGLPWSSDTAALSEDLREISVKVRGILKDALGSKPKLETLYDASTHLITAGGKVLRPYLAVKSCEVVGGCRDDALPAAAAVELLHTFSLIHDDIIDDDKTRRGVLTVHAKWGVPVAIIAGDMLFAKVFETVVNGSEARRIPPDRAVRVLSLLAGAAVNLCEGQMLDMTFPKLREVGEEDYVSMVGKKTAYLFKTAAQVGATVGGGSDLQVEKLGEFGYLSGIAFQIVDDVLGLTGDEKTLGKPVGSDVKEGKKTLPVIHALRKLKPEQRKVVLKAMRRSSTQSQILKARDTIVKLGSVAYATNKAGEIAKKAVEQLDVFPDSPAKKALISFTNLLVSRKF